MKPSSLRLLILCCYLKDWNTSHSWSDDWQPGWQRQIKVELWLTPHPLSGDSPQLFYLHRGGLWSAEDAELIHHCSNALKHKVFHSQISQVTGWMMSFYWNLIPLFFICILNIRDVGCLQDSRCPSPSVSLVTDWVEHEVLPTGCSSLANDESASAADVSLDGRGKPLAWGWGSSGSGLTRALFFTRVDRTEEEKQRSVNLTAYVLRYCTWLGRTFSGEVFSCTHCFAAQVTDHVVHRGLVAEENGPNHFVVDDLGAIPWHRSHAPQQEETLDARQTEVDDCRPSGHMVLICTVTTSLTLNA